MCKAPDLSGEKVSYPGSMPAQASAPTVRKPTLRQTLRRETNRGLGMLLFLNFALCWAVPIAGMGQAFHLGLKHLFTPPYDWLDRSPTFRAFATKYIYSKPQYADFAASAAWTLLSVSSCFAGMIYWQLKHGSLPLWLCFAYNCTWVGCGGRVMGAAYTFAHKEGHNAMIYQRWIRKSVGNIFENWVGVLFGNVPWNFTTSHMHLHHALDGGKGDSFYQWDLDRSSSWDFLLFNTRIFNHMVGLSSLERFHKLGYQKQFHQLRNGMAIFWLLVPAALYAITRSAFFLLVIWLQPLLAMTSFLAIVNWGFHAFILLDQNGEHVPCVNSLTIIDGQDDYFGEDDHMAHHYSPQTWYTKVHEFQERMHADIVKHHGSVFKKISIVELGILVILNQFERIAELHYVDHSGTLSTQQAADMLRARARHKEMEYDDYLDWLHTFGPRSDRRLHRDEDDSAHAKAN